MPPKLTIVVSQGQSASPDKRKLEEDLVAGLLFERGIEVTVIPHLYDLKADGTGMLCLQGITGDMVVLSWLFPRGAHWTLDRNGIRGQFGTTLLASGDDDEEDGEPEAEDASENKPRVGGRVIPNRTIYHLDLRAHSKAQPYLDEIKRIAGESSVQTVSLMSWIGGSPKPEQMARYLDPQSATPATPGEQLPGEAGGSASSELDAIEPPAAAGGYSAATNVPLAPIRIDEAPGRRWYPVIDYSRCTNCMECIDFCLFGVYGVDRLDTILVEQPDNCRKGCPACSRVCPENAILFPQHKTPAIAGSPEGSAGGLKIDLSQLFGAPSAIEVAALERDVELVAVGRDAVGLTVGIPKRQAGKDQGPKDDLDDLIDELDDFG